MKKSLKEKGITLIALVVTIIILLIIAGVTIGVATNGTGLFEKAKLATDKYNNEVEKENVELSKTANQIDEAIASNRENGVSYTLLWEGTADTKNTKYSFKDGVGDIEDYDFILIEYTQLTILRHSITINTSSITKEATYDLALWGHDTRFTSLHFTDKGFVIDQLEGTTYYNYPRKIYGLKY